MEGTLSGNTVEFLDLKGNCHSPQVLGFGGYHVTKVNYHM